MQDQSSSSIITKPKVAVLLSLYNGEKYLEEQLASLLSQTYQNFIVVVRDDGSTDNSLKIVESAAESVPDKFHLVPKDSVNRGARDSFAFLIHYVLDNKSLLGLDYAYMMFCDQDDIWFNSKIEVQARAMFKAEEGKFSVPVLVHSDLEVVSEQAKTIAPSLIRYQGLEIERNQFPNLVISNLVTGCTAMINESLAKKSLPIHGDAIMHDWWLALIASAFGSLIYLDEPLIFYRQHGNNTIGAKEFVKPPVISRSYWQKIVARKANEHLIEVGIQASAFRRCYSQDLSYRSRFALLLCCAMKIRIGFVQRVFYRLARRF